MTVVLRNVFNTIFHFFQMPFHALSHCALANDRKQAYFVDLFVRMSNKVAIDMYQRLGYSVYRRVLEYYSGDPDEDAFGKFTISTTTARTIKFAHA